MRLAKLSLAAIVAIGVSAFADVENVKFSGNAKLYYGTNDANVWSGTLADHSSYTTPSTASGSIFDKDNSYGQAAVNLAMSADLADGVAGKIEVTGLATLGLENNLVSDTWAGPEGGVSAQWWVSEAWLAKTFSNTTVKVGRQELDTPLAFSEKWNITENTFDAAVVLNNDLPDTTLVAAWVGRGNGAACGKVVRGVQNGTDPFRTYGSTIVKYWNKVAQEATNNPNLDITQAGVEASGAYALAAVTKLIPNTVAQVWYYNVVDIADAWWLQADVDLGEVAPGLTFGAQYALISLDDIDNINVALNANYDDSSAWAVKVGYKFDALSVAAAYSSTDSDGLVSIANTATGLGQGSQSKLYTEAWWNYGYVGRPDTDTWMISAEYNMEGIADFYAQYTSADQGRKGGDVDMSEFTLTASKSFGSLDATLAYIYTDADDQNVNPNTGNSDSYNTIQVYLTYNF